MQPQGAIGGKPKVKPVRKRRCLPWVGRSLNERRDSGHQVFFAPVIRQQSLLQHQMQKICPPSETAKSPLCSSSIPQPLQAAVLTAEGSGLRCSEEFLFIRSNGPLGLVLGAGPPLIESLAQWACRHRIPCQDASVAEQKEPGLRDGPAVVQRGQLGRIGRWLSGTGGLPRFQGKAMEVLGRKKGGRFLSPLAMRYSFSLLSFSTTFWEISPGTSS